MPKILAIDWGMKRIGLAVCDELGMTVRGLPTLIRKNRATDLAAICERIAEENVELLLVGEPSSKPGSTSQAEQFGRSLAKRTKLDLVMWDEQLTSFEADSLMKDSGVRRIAKPDTDQGAAAVILQSYLNSC